MRTNRKADNLYIAMPEKIWVPCTLFQQHQLFQLAVREHQRLARGAVSQAVLESSGQIETTSSLELRQAQLDITGNEICSFDLVTKPKMLSTAKSTYGTRAKKQKRHQMESEPRAFLRIIGPVSQERDFVHQEAPHLHDSYHWYELAAHAPFGKKFIPSTFQCHEARKTRVVLSRHSFNIIILKVSIEVLLKAIEQCSKVEEGRAFYRKYKEEKTTRGAAGTRFPSREGNDGLSKPFPRFAWADTSTGLSRSHAR